MRLPVVICLACTFSTSYAETTYLGLYLKGNKIGYASYDSSLAKMQGESLTKSASFLLLNAGLLGSEMKVTIDSTAWTFKSGQPVKMIFDTESGGRSNRVEASFIGRRIAMKISNGGVNTSRTLDVPKGAQVVADPLTVAIESAMPAGTSKTFYVLDPSTASLLQNRVEMIGAAKTTVNGRTVAGRLIKMTDPSSETDVFVDKRGQLIRVNGPMGIVMLPVSRTVALRQSSAYHPSADLSLATSLKPDRAIEDPSELSRLKLTIVGENIGPIPSGQYQTATKVSNGWRLDIHPPKLESVPTGTIVQASSGKTEWLRPSLNVPCDDQTFKNLAAKIVGSKKMVQDAAFAIQNYVYLNMKPNPGIGVLRDATEVLKSKEGVCRDYATLTVTLLRSAGIPARFASGLVNWDGTFYYHAWAEAWDGSRWIGVDSTTDRAQLSASHVKLGEGNIDTAFSFTFLEKSRIEILEARRD